MLVSIVSTCLARCWVKRGQRDASIWSSKTTARGGNYGFRVGNWKLLRHDSQKTRNTKLRLQGRPIGRYELFDLESDPSESDNVIKEHAEVAEKMQTQLAELIEAGRSRP